MNVQLFSYAVIILSINVVFSVLHDWLSNSKNQRRLNFIYLQKSGWQQCWGQKVALYVYLMNPQSYDFKCKPFFQSVHNYFLSWGTDTNSIEADVQANLQAAESAAVNAVQDIKDDVEYAAAEAQSGISSFYERLREKLQDIRANISNFFDLDDDFQSPDYYMNKLFNLAPQQLSVVQDMLSGWTQRAQNFARDEWEFRKGYLIAAKQDLHNTIMALNNGDFDSALEYFQSAMINVRDESAIYRALQYALEQDPSMIPLVSNLSASLLENLEFDLSTEV